MNARWRCIHCKRWGGFYLLMIMLCYSIMGWIILYTGYRIISLCVAEKHRSLLFVLPQTNRQTNKQTVSHSVGRSTVESSPRERDRRTDNQTDGGSERQVGGHTTDRQTQTDRQTDRLRARNASRRTVSKNQTASQAPVAYQTGGPSNWPSVYFWLTL